MNARDLFDLTDKVAVVTGALGKLGPLWAGALLDAGAKVAALDLPVARESSEYQALAARASQDRLCRFDADVTDNASLRQALDRCSEHFGVPDILVNNAGIDQPPAEGVGTRWWYELPADDCLKVLQVNVLGVFMTTQVFGKAMLDRGHGSVINIGSLYASVSPDERFYDHLPGEVPFQKPPMYGTSKAGVVSLTRWLATHLANNGVRVNTLSPGGVAGGQDEQFRAKYHSRVPLKRMAEGGDLIGPLLFLASDASAYVTGAELRVDGGYTAW